MGTKSANLYLQNAAGMTGMGMVNMSNAVNLPQQSILPQPIVKTGRPIVNTTNLAANNLQQHQVIMHFIPHFLNMELKSIISYFYSNHQNEWNVPKLLPMYVK